MRTQRSIWRKRIHPVRGFSSAVVRRAPPASAALDETASYVLDDLDFPPGQVESPSQISQGTVSVASETEDTLAGVPAPRRSAPVEPSDGASRSRSNLQPQRLTTDCARSCDHRRRRRRGGLALRRGMVARSCALTTVNSSLSTCGSCSLVPFALGFAEFVVDFVDRTQIEKLRQQRLRGFEQPVDSPLHLRIVTAKRTRLRCRA